MSQMPRALTISLLYLISFLCGCIVFRPTKSCRCPRRPAEPSLSFSEADALNVYDSRVQGGPKWKPLPDYQKNCFTLY